MSGGELYDDPIMIHEAKYMKRILLACMEILRILPILYRILRYNANFFFEFKKNSGKTDAFRLYLPQHRCCEKRFTQSCIGTCRIGFAEVDLKGGGHSFGGGKAKQSAEPFILLFFGKSRQP